MSEEFKPIQTQEDFDAAIKSRLARERVKAIAPFADYEALKAKAAKLDEIEEKGKSDLERANERIAELEGAAKKREEADRVEALKKKVSKATGVPVDLISGSDEESMTAFAEAVASYAKKPSAPNVPEAGKCAGAFSADGMSDFVGKLFGEK